MDEVEYGKKPRQKAVVAVYLILWSGDSFLMMLRQNTGYQDGNWDVPSGHLEEGELPTEAIVREAKEEIGIDLDPCHVTLTHVIFRTAHDPTGNRIDLFFTCKVPGYRDKVIIGEPEKCKNLYWFHVSEFPDIPENTVPHVREAIIKTDVNNPFSEFGEEWLKERGLYKL